MFAAGKESTGQFPARAPEAMAAELGREFVILPSHHGGFMGDEFGFRGEPAAFAATLLKVLDGPGRA